LREAASRPLGVAESSIKRMGQDEGFPVARGANIEAVCNTLADAGIIFLFRKTATASVSDCARLV
jgi:hypothetical protein